MALTWIADKSALVRIRHPTVDARLTLLLVGGSVATCDVVELEVLFSARSHEDLVATRTKRAVFPRLAMSQLDFTRAVEVLEALALRGQHRAAGIPALLIAAVAERYRLRVLHYDKDFDLIAKVTGQATEWVVPSGSVP